MTSYFSIVEILIMFGIISVVIFITALWLASRLQEQKRREREAEDHFQRELKTEFMNPGGSRRRSYGDSIGEEEVTSEQLARDAISEIDSLDAPPPSRARIAASGSLPIAAGGKFHLNPSSATPLADQLIMHLKEAGVFVSSEGPYMVLDPSGQCILVRLKKNKNALIVPRFESEHFLFQAIKRFDYVFLVLSGGETLVLNKYTDFIAGQFDFH